MKKHFLSYLICILLIFNFGITGCSRLTVHNDVHIQSGSCAENVSEVSEFSGSPYEVINGNVPEFNEEDYTTEPFEMYSKLDSLGRCGAAYANICKEIMPTQKRGEIGMIKPSGWHTVKYDFVDGMYLYNRCHLIGYQLSGENANEENLITGTRYMNTQGMLPFEDMVDDYVDATDNHVLYRVTPVYEGNNLVADGVQMEGWSVEDNGAGICFNVYVFNVQPGVNIDYATGESSLSDEPAAYSASGQNNDSSHDGEYVLNTNTNKFHYPDCASAGDISSENRKVTHKSRKKLINQGYTPCGRCKP